MMTMDEIKKNFWGLMLFAFAGATLSVVKFMSAIGIKEKPPEESFVWDVLIFCMKKSGMIPESATFDNFQDYL